MTVWRWAAGVPSISLLPALGDLVEVGAAAAVAVVGEEGWRWSAVRSDSREK